MKIIVIIYNRKDGVVTRSRTFNKAPTLPRIDETVALFDIDSRPIYGVVTKVIHWPVNSVYGTDVFVRLLPEEFKAISRNTKKWKHFGQMDIVPTV